MATHEQVQFGAKKNSTGSEGGTVILCKGSEPSTCLPVTSDAVP
jgi:hypothetical protein